MTDLDKLVGKRIALGSKSFSEKEIFEFAKFNDPLPFHLSQSAAKDSKFKGLVCSGSQTFNYFYVNSWIPKFGNSVLAGMGVNEWKFLNPIYEGDTINAFCMVSELEKAKLNCEIIVNWKFEFKNETNDLVQQLNLTVLHQKRTL